MLALLAGLILRGPVTVTDLNGHPFELGNAGPVRVVVFLGNECPVSNAYAEELKRIVATFSAKGVRFLGVYPEADVTAEDVRRHLREYGMNIDVALDPKLAAVNWTGATRMPEAAVIDRAGIRRYRGRIDNLYASLGNRRAHVTKHDLRDAIAAVLAGKKVAEPVTAAIGCVIPR